jgi:YD repeat-containing protein
MYGLIGKMVATPGNRDALAAIILNGAGVMPGCLSYIVAKHPRDGNALWITEVWDSAERHEASLSHPGVREAIALGGRSSPALATVCRANQLEGMAWRQNSGAAIERLNPQGLSTPTGYSHAPTRAARRSTSGQVAYDAKGNLIGKDDLAAQTKQVFENLGIALKAAGATFANVVKTNYYIELQKVAVVCEPELSPVSCRSAR